MKIVIEDIKKTANPNMSNKDRRLGEVSLSFSDENYELVIKTDIREHEGEEGARKYVRFPSRKAEIDGKTVYPGVARPRNAKTTEVLSDYILKAFEGEDVNLDIDFNLEVGEIRNVEYDDSNLSDSRFTLTGIVDVNLVSDEYRITIDAKILEKLASDEGQRIVNVSFPSRPKFGDEEGYYPTAFPTNSQTYDLIKNAVLDMKQ